MMTEVEHPGSAQYTFGTDKEWRFVALIGICLLSFELAIVLLFVIAALGGSGWQGRVRWGWVWLPALHWVPTSC